MTKTHFGNIKVGDSFIYGVYIYKRVSAYQAINCHDFTTRKFKLDQSVEVAPN